MSEDTVDTGSPTATVAAHLAHPGFIPEKLAGLGWFLGQSESTKITMKTDVGDIEINLGTMLAMVELRDDVERVAYASCLSESLITGDRVEFLYTVFHMMLGVSMKGKGRQQLLDLAIKRSKVINVTENVQRVRQGLMNRLRGKKGDPGDKEAAEDVYGK